MSSINNTMKCLSDMGITPSCEPLVMGILNCTPDSFFEGSRKQTEEEIALRAEEIIRQGGRIIDVGAFSTRPGAQEVNEAEELRRMRFALQILRREMPEALLSIDTYRPAVARMAVEEYGANIINDVSEGGLTGIVDTPLEEDAPSIFQEMARLKVPYILMSVQRDMATMLECFTKEVALLRQLGVEDIILDPGYGFGKDVIAGNFSVLKQQGLLREVFPELPILAGMSRKRMMWQLLGGTPKDEPALHGTMLANLIALQNGANILRVHDVSEAVETIKVFQAVSV